MFPAAGDEDAWLAVAIEMTGEGSGLDADLRHALASPTPHRLMQAAFGLVEQARLDEAERIFRALCAEPATRARALVGLARIAGRRGDLDGAAAAWDEAIAEAGDRSEPFWRLQSAAAERGRGRRDAAAAILRQCRALHPDYAPAAAALANLLTEEGRAEAAGAWRETMRRFAAEASPWWYASHAHALRAGGAHEEAQRLLDALLERFPDAPASLAIRAQHAMASREWSAALALWERAATPPTREALKGRGLCLFRLGAIEPAFALWREAVALWPDYDAGRLVAIHAALEMGWMQTALDFVNALIAQAEARLRPEWLGLRGTCLLALRRFEAAQETARQAQLLFPSSPTGWELALRRAELRRDPLAAQMELAVEARARFPEWGEFLRRFVELALAAGRIEEASHAVADWPDAADPHATLARWRVIQQRDGIGALAPQALRDLAQADRSLAGRLLLGEHLLALSGEWAVRAALEVFETLEREQGARPAVLAGLARARIGLDRRAEALAAADAIADLCRTEAALDVKAWAAHARGQEGGARRLEGAMRSARYAPAVHAPAPRLELLKSAPARGGVTAFVPVRDERAMLPGLLRHHRKLGVRRFVCVDNGSTDGGLDYLARQPDVTLYATRDPFGAAGSGMRWINALIEREGDGGFSLFVDADERFVFPGCETRGLDHLVRHLDDEGAEGVAAFMLDMFPARLFDARGRATPASRYVYFDADYVRLGHVRPPWFRMVGGVRSRLFGVQDYLHKVPLLRGGAAVYLNNHETTPLRLAEITGALAHLKLMSLATRADAGPHALREGNRTRIPETQRRYWRYDEVLADLRGADLRGPKSRRLDNSWALADLGLVHAPAAWRA